jgi:hypothetical protein
MAIYIYFVTAPYADPGTEMAMLLFYNGLLQSTVQGMNETHDSALLKND